MGLKMAPQILPFSSLQEAEGETPAQPLSEAGLRSSLSQTEGKVRGFRDWGTKGPRLHPTLSFLEGVPRKARP